MSESSERSVVVKWNAAILITLVIYGITTIWWLAKLDARVEQHAVEINEIKQGSSVLISREQLTDLLSGRDERLSGIEKSVTRIEQKIDQIK